MVSARAMTLYATCQRRGPEALGEEIMARESVFMGTTKIDPQKTIAEINGLPGACQSRAGIN